VAQGTRVLGEATLIEAAAAINPLPERANSAPPARALTHYERRSQACQAGKKTRQGSPPTPVSHSDPDAPLGSRPGPSRKLSSQAQATRDAARRVILDCPATTGAQPEWRVFPERRASLLDERQLPREEALAEQAYGRGPPSRFLRRRKVRASPP
jgi:hypothetical protein